MPNVQQPEMRRSGDDPLVQDNAKAKAQRREKPREQRDERHGPVPEEQRPKHPD